MIAVLVMLHSFLVILCVTVSAEDSAACNDSC
jgi:hypothetical protein